MSGGFSQLSLAKIILEKHVFFTNRSKSAAVWALIKTLLMNPCQNRAGAVEKAR